MGLRQNDELGFIKWMYREWVNAYYDQQKQIAEFDRLVHDNHRTILQSMINHSLKKDPYQDLINYKELNSYLGEAENEPYEANGPVQKALEVNLDKIKQNHQRLTAAVGFLKGSLADPNVYNAFIQNFKSEKTKNKKWINDLEEDIKSIEQNTSFVPMPFANSQNKHLYTALSVATLGLMPALDVVATVGSAIKNAIGKMQILGLQQKVDRLHKTKDVLNAMQKGVQQLMDQSHENPAETLNAAQVTEGLNNVVTESAESNGDLDFQFNYPPTNLQSAQPQPKAVSSQGEEQATKPSLLANKPLIWSEMDNVKNESEHIKNTAFEINLLN